MSLYRTVWETEYIGDIQSLHAHIKMLREAVGEVRAFTDALRLSVGKDTV